MKFGSAFEQRLRDWGLWRVMEVSGLGYPKSASFTKLRVSGAKTQQSCDNLINDNAEEINEHVQGLDRVNHRAALILIEEYTGVGDQYVKSRRLKLSNKSYRHNLYLAKMFI